METDLFFRINILEIISVWLYLDYACEGHVCVRGTIQIIYHPDILSIIESVNTPQPNQMDPD